MDPTIEEGGGIGFILQLDKDLGFCARFMITVRWQVSLQSPIEFPVARSLAIELDVPVCSVASSFIRVRHGFPDAHHHLLSWGGKGAGQHYKTGLCENDAATARGGR